MAVYKIFPTQDATLYSEYPEMNTGLDAICEVSNMLNGAGSPVVTRYRTLFDTDEIKDILSNKVKDNSFGVYLKNFIATAQGLNADTTIEIYPVAQSWNNGTGVFGDSPQTKDGVSWNYANFSGSGNWSPSGSINGFPYTSSYNSAYASAGGGNWFYDTGSNLYVVINYMSPFYTQGNPLSLPSSASYGLRTVKDLEANVSLLVQAWAEDYIPNYGFITKLDENAEFNPSQNIQPILKYYSVDTNTIYPPCLEFRWRDYSTVLTSSLINNIVDTTDIKLALNENPGVFYPSSVNRFRVNVSPLYPPRTFQTSSYFTNSYFLPTSSYYAIKDLDTNEYVVTFDEQYTQISSDEYGNYFDVYMSGLEPERYYTVLIQTNINGSTLVFNDQYYFKVVNG
jgi:hypothetical protein